MENTLGNNYHAYPYYSGNDLGVQLNEKGFTAKIWAPTANEVRIKIYKYAYGENLLETIALEPNENGCWQTQKNGSYKGLHYTIQVKTDKWLNETPGIDACATGVNGRRGLFFSKDQTNPMGWRYDKPIPYTNMVDAILYEVHVRDFSISENSGMQNKGKFLAFTERGTRNSKGLRTGIEHLRELGITHVHLMPIADYWTVDELKPQKRYNWGYDPLNYNTPEGSYATNPNGITRILELKKLIIALHKAGIGIILDVVYNHTGLTKRSWFNQTVPGYYYRQNQNGEFSNASGCGNELATERPMVRKYIIDSLKYWATEFNIDGFRFDLMGIIDIETMKEIRAEMDKLRQGILLYGEGWTADHSPLDEHQLAIKRNTPQLGNIASFSDDFRDTIKGHNFNINEKGFVNGKAFAEENVKFGITAACHHPQIEYGYTNGLQYAWAEQPYQVINYASCHDNYTLYDKLKASNSELNEKKLMKMQMLALALVITSQGVPFIHAGSEFCRTKNGNHNSYKSSDKINQIDWDRKSDYKKLNDYVVDLIALRKAMPSLRMRNSDEIRKHIQFLGNYHKQTMSYTISDYPNELWTNVHLVFNARQTGFVHHLPWVSEWSIIAEEDKIDINGISKVDGDYIVVPPLSMMILVET